MTTIIAGKSAKGKTRLLIGPCYTFHFREWVTPVMTVRLPPELAWTEMNTSWKKGKRR